MLSEQEASVERFLFDNCTFHSTAVVGCLNSFSNSFRVSACIDCLPVLSVLCVCVFVLFES